MKCLIIIFVVFAMLRSIPLLAEDSWRTQTAGYINDVHEEQTTIIVDMVIPETPITDSLAWHKIIFDDKISQELRLNYENRFGYSRLSNQVNSGTKFEEVSYSTGVQVSLRESLEEQNSYGQYLLKRLGEYHFDRVMKTNPRARKIYEFKEKISKMKIEVKKGYSLNMRYYYSGNYMDFKLDTPFNVKQTVSLRMDPDSFGPTGVDNIAFTTEISIDKKTNYTLYFETLKEWLSVSYNRSIAPGMGISFGLESFLSEQISNLGSTENRLLIGFSWQH